MPDQTVTIPTGPNSATIQVLDAQGADITGSCSFVATSSDPTIVQVGNPDSASPNVIPLNAAGAPGSSATLSYQASNSMGEITETDTINLQLTAPGSMTVTYGSVIPQAAAKHTQN